MSAQKRRTRAATREATCAYCGVTFLHDTSHRRTYCGRSCSGKGRWVKTPLRGADAPNYLGPLARLAHPLYRTWIGIGERCDNPQHKDYPRYGGRGITVDPRWRGHEGFNHFVADMGPRPAGRSLDRIDNDGPYAPENCRWATTIEQRRNQARYINKRVAS